MRAALPEALKVCLVTPYPPQEKGAAEYANMFVEALHRSRFQRQLQVRLISETSKQCSARSRTLLYPPENNFILERVYPDKLPYSNLSFLKIFKAILKDKPHVAHFYWPGGFGGFLGDFSGETLIVLFALLRLLSIKTLVTVHSVWLPGFAEEEAFKRIKSRLAAKAIKAYFFIFMFIFWHLVNKILIGVVRERSVTTRRFAESYKISYSKIGEEPSGCLEIARRDRPNTRKIKRGLNLTGKKVILCFGFIRPEKGLEYAIEASAGIAKKNRNVTLVIAGKAESVRNINYLAKLRNLVKELNSEGNVVFDNRFIPREEVMDYYSVADVLLLPYTQHVGFSGPLVTAVSLGVPVIATSVGKHMPELEELVKLVPPKNVEALKEAIDGILSSDTLIEEIKAKLRSHATRYGWSEIAERLVKIYSSMLLK